MSYTPDAADVIWIDLIPKPDMSKPNAVRPPY